MTFNRNNFLKKNSSTTSGGGGLTPEQEALLVEAQEHLTEANEGTNQWQVMMIGHEIVTSVTGDAFLIRG